MASLARPGFDALMAQVKSGAVDAVLVESVDRLSRDQADALGLYKELAFRGVRLLTVADGVDSDSKHGKMTYDLKALVSQVFLDDLRDKTKRGMAGRAHAGLATGGKLVGYSTKPIGDPRKPSGFKIAIDEQQADVIRRIFAAYVRGRSCKEIARTLNADGVPAPRASAGTRHKLRPSWANSSIAAMLANERYAGVWRFGERVWIKKPGTNKRVSRPAPPDTVITQKRPELAIIARLTWDDVAARRAAVYATYAGSSDKPKGRAVSGRMDRHPLSGLLRCECEAPFTVSRGKNRDYLARADAKRGRCSIRKSLREDLAVQCMSTAICSKLAGEAGIAYVRRRVAERLAEVARGRDGQANEVRKRIARTERRLANLVDMLAEGDKSTSVRSAVADLETQLNVDRGALAAVEATARAPLHLPTVIEAMDEVFYVLKALKEDPVAAREALARWFKNACITMELGDDGVYTGRSELLPLVLFKSEKADPLFEDPPISALVAGAGDFSFRLCSGR